MKDLNALDTKIMIDLISFMKRILLFFTIIFLLISCRENNLISGAEIPEWLEKEIAQDEVTIKSDPQLMPNYGAWIRYEFQGENYYEYNNPLSSSIRAPYSQDGVQINITIAPFTDYWNEKCCEELVWKAPGYNELWKDI